MPKAGQSSLEVLETLLFNLRVGVARMELHSSLASFAFLRGLSFRILNLSQKPPEMYIGADFSQLRESSRKLPGSLVL